MAEEFHLQLFHLLRVFTLNADDQGVVRMTKRMEPRSRRNPVR